MKGMSSPLSGRFVRFAALFVIALGSWIVIKHDESAATTAVSLVSSGTDAPAKPDEAAIDQIARVMFPQLFDSISPIHQQLVMDRIAAERSPDLLNRPPVMLCFSPDTPQELQEALTIGMDFPGRYNQISRWSSTATGSTGGQGDRITLTYSFVADGVTIPQISGVSFPAGNNQLHQWLNGIYGSQATWKPLFDQVFQRWGQLAGITYVYEPNDDGVTMNQNPGVLGVRGDVRIGAKVLDGNSGVLAYNNFPNDGDMVFDAFDSFFNVTSSNSLRLRNVIAHEHGHGIGMLHVCPIQQIKLMEPFVSTSFDGPRHDDIRNAHRHYGDPFEPDNSPATATDLGDFNIGSSLVVGNPPAPIILQGSILSIDADGERDYFYFEVSQPASISVTVTPIGTTYDDSDQACSGSSGSCCSGNNVNSLAIANLAVDVLAADGITVLGSANANAAGLAETASDVPLDIAGGYFIRVSETNNPTQSQLYRLNFSIGAPIFEPVKLSFPNGVPAELTTGVPKTFAVTITPGDEAVVPGSETLFYRYDGGAFQSVPLTHISGTTYTATLPAPTCDDSPEFYVSAEGTVTGVHTNPAGGATSPLTAIVGPVSLRDNFETDQGWTVTSTPIGGTFDGAWQRGVPVNLNRGDPPADFDGSGQCYLTDNDPGNSNSDVDNGSTSLTSPVLITEAGDVISYAYWFNDIPSGQLQGGDSLRVEIATDAGGTNWTTVRNYTTTLNEWRTDALVAGTDFTPSQTTRVRFTANDIGVQNVIEAGIDAFLADGCIDPPTPDVPTGLFAGDAESCDSITLTWNAATGAESYEIWRNIENNTGSGSMMMLANDVTLTTFEDETAIPGSIYFYWVKACNGNGCSNFSTPDVGVTLMPPAAPADLTATTDTICGAVELDWSAAVGATSYTVWRNLVDDLGTAENVGTSTEASFRDATGDPANAYFYWVSAANECGDGEASASATGSAAPRGDFDLNGLIDGADLQGFVDALLGDAGLFECADLAPPFATLDDDDIAAMLDLLLAE